MTIMSAQHRTPQTGRVLQVGRLMPSLVQTLRDDYDAYVLPDDPGDAACSWRRTAPRSPPR